MSETAIAIFLGIFGGLSLYNYAELRKLRKDYDRLFDHLLCMNDVINDNAKHINKVMTYISTLQIVVMKLMGLEVEDNDSVDH